MSAFSERIINTMRTAYQYTIGGKNDDEQLKAAQTTAEETQGVKTPQTSSGYTTSPISVVNPTGQTTGEVTDQYVPGADSKTSDKEPETEKTPQEKVNTIFVELRNACKDADINFAQLLLNLSAITGKTLAQFHEMDAELKAELLSYVKESVERFTAKKAEGKIDNVDGLEAVTMDTYLMYNFITNDKNGKKLDLAKMSPKEVEQRRKICEAKLKEHRQKCSEKIKSLPEDKQEAAKEELKTTMDDMRLHVFNKVSKDIPFESALQLMLIVASKDVGEAAEKLMESYPPEIREKLASTMQNFDNFIAYVNAAKERGENINTENARAAFEKYHRIFGSYKDKKSFQNYEKQYMAARVENTLPYEVLQATAMGIGEAAYTNHVMSSAEKDAVLSTWVRDNDKFLSDAQMENVEFVSQQYINEYLEKHPEEREHFAFATKSIKYIVEEELQREFKPENSKQARAAEKRNKTEASEKPSQTSDNPSQTSAATYVSSPAAVQFAGDEVSGTSPVRLNQGVTAAEEPSQNQENEEKVRYALVEGTMTVQDAYKKIGEDKTIRLIIKDQTLRAVHKSEIELYIAKYHNDKEKMQNFVEHAPDDLKLLAISQMTDGAKFAEDLIKEHKVSHDMTVILKNKELQEKD